MALLGRVPAAGMALLHRRGSGEFGRRAGKGRAISWTCGLALLSLAGTAPAGNIVITGHDDDLHAGGCGVPSAAAAQLKAMISFARSGAPDPSLPVLSFDHGRRVTDCLTALNIRFTNVDPDEGIPAPGYFLVTKYSAIVVASDATCGGCDNTATSIKNMTSASAPIGAFLNRGGGIVAFAGAANAASYYGFLPASASGFGSPPSDHYVTTAFGDSIHIPAVNGNETHNFFFEPGTGGVSAIYKVVERWEDKSAETLACRDCTTSRLIRGAGFSSALYLPLSGVIGVAAAVGLVKMARLRLRQDRSRRVQETGFCIRVAGDIQGRSQSGYNLNIHSVNHAHSRRTE